jgi:hypothetical protein
VAGERSRLRFADAAPPTGDALLRPVAMHGPYPLEIADGACSIRIGCTRAPSAAGAPHSIHRIMWSMVPRSLANQESLSTLALATRRAILESGKEELIELADAVANAAHSATVDSDYRQIQTD